MILVDSAVWIDFFNGRTTPQTDLLDGYRALRRRGVRARKTVDVIIATFCIRYGRVLLQSDRDFQPMTEHLGLRTL